MRDSFVFAAFLSLVYSVAVFSEQRATPFLYAIKNEHGVSFLFGSIHAPFALNKFPEVVVKSLRSKPLFVSEVLDDRLAAAINVETPIGLVRGHPSAAAIRELKKRGIPEYLYDSPSLCDSYLIWWDFVPNPGPILDGALEKLAIQDHKHRLDLDDDEDIQSIF